MSSGIKALISFRNLFNLASSLMRISTERWNMGNIGGQVLSGIFLVLFTLVVEASLTFAFSSKGTYQYNIIEGIDSKSQAILRFSNHSDSELNNIKVLVPKDLSISEVHSSIPVAIDTVDDRISLNRQKILEISLVPAGKNVTILIPLMNIEMCCELLNGGEIAVKHIKSNDSESRLANAISSGIQSALIYIIILSIFLWGINSMMKHEFKKSSARLDEVEKRHQKDLDEYKSQMTTYKELGEYADSRRERVEKRLSDAEKVYWRFKTTTLKRLSDYSKELDFWRDTIRKVLYTANIDKSHAEKLIDDVTNSLKTYTTRKNFVVENEALQSIEDALSTDSKETGVSTKN